jgi:CBS domain containing-hemolysin-like protein
MDVEVIIILLSLVLSAFFSGMEIAYISSNKIYIEIEKKQGGFISVILSKLTAKPSKFITSMLIGNNIALVIYGFVMGDLLMTWFETFANSSNGFYTYIFVDLKLLTQTVISTGIILITAEFLPKVFFQIYANTLLKALALPAYVFYVLFSVFSEFSMWISNVILRIVFKTTDGDPTLELSKVELGNYISEQMEAIEEDVPIDSEVQFFQNALDFSSVKARDVMVPRTEIIAQDIEESLDDLRHLFIETGCSKVLIYKEDIDDVLGYVHAFELFKKPKSIKSVLRPVEFVPETMLVKDIMNTLTKKRKSMAVVIDEYGGTSGLLTLEDIIEELFGEIEDEHDKDEMIEEQISQNTFKFSARLEVDYLNETYKLGLPEDDSYETLGGLIVNKTEGIPQLNDEVSIDQFAFKILEASSTKINTVQLDIRDVE